MLTLKSLYGIMDSDNDHVHTSRQDLIYLMESTSQLHKAKNMQDILEEIIHPIIKSIVSIYRTEYTVISKM